MAIGKFLQAWRRTRQYSTAKLATESGIDSLKIEAIELGNLDPSVSMVEALARGLAVPPAWLYSTPKAIELLLGESNGGNPICPELDSPDPITANILLGSQTDRDLYVLLTSLLRHGEPKLLRAAEVNLRSLLKQARTATLPWQTRPSGHFEPPSD